MSGWIKIHRRILQWEWYSDTNTVRLFLHLLLNANYEDKRWRGFEIKRGQVVTGRLKLSQETNLSEQQVRRCLERLKSTNEITIKATNKYTIITINKYEEYQHTAQENNQEINQQDNQQITNKQPTNNQQITTTKEIKKEKKYKERKEERIIPKPDGLFFVSDEQWNDWVQHRNEIKKPLTPLAVKQLTTKLTQFYKQGYDCNDLISTSITNGWQGIFEPKLQKTAVPKSFAQIRHEKEMNALKEFAEENHVE